jgi:hypothetical protein
MKKYLIYIYIIIAGSSFGQSDSVHSKNHDLNSLNGIWIIDLRPNPESEPYLKNFVVKILDNIDFKGSFYDTEFNNGKLNLNWDSIFFLFTQMMQLTVIIIPDTLKETKS